MKIAVGQQLRQAREARLLTIEQAAQATRIKPHHLIAMEAGTFDTLLSQAQARGFLRAYADFLKLDDEPLLKALEAPTGVPAENEAAGSTQPASTPASSTASQPAPEVDNTVASIFAEIGQRLKHQRELLGLSLEDVVRHTHLRLHYLKALEEGTLEALPSPVQGRGMLNNYATFLGLNPEPLLLRFAEGLQASLEARRAMTANTHPKTRPRPTRLPLSVRRWLSAEVFIGVLLAVLLTGFVTWGAIRIFSMNTNRSSSPTAPSISAVLLATPSPQFTRSAIPSKSPAQTPEGLSEPVAVENEGEMLSEPTEETPGVQPSDLQSGAQVRVYITVYQRSWLRVIVDGKTEYEGRVLPGSAYNFSGTDKVEILISNGAGIQVFFNQQDLGRLGAFGQIVSRIFTAKGQVTATPTITPTARPTQRPTATPAVEASRTPAGTPTRPALP